MKGMSIKEVADLCYVSQASISRFCRFFGFENFKEFRECLSDEFCITDNYSKQFRSMLCEDEQMAVSAYRDELVENIYSTINATNMKLMPEIVDMIHNSLHVAYFSHHFLWDIGRFFQSKMMMMDKYVEQFMDYEAQMECAKGLTKDSFAIICSIGGSYISRYVSIWRTLLASRCKILVITQNINSIYLNSVDYVMQCGISNKDDTGKYAAMMIIDYLVMSCLLYTSPSPRDA